MRKSWKMGLVVVMGLGLAGCAWLFAPPGAVLTATPTSGPAPLSVTFSAAGSTGGIVSFTIDFGDGTPVHTGTDIAVGVSHTYTTPGTYTATLTVLDNRGQTDSATVAITVTAPATTSVSLVALPASGPVPLAVAFSATITAAPGRRIRHLALDPDTGGPLPAYTFVVDFATFSGPIVTHTYTAAGTYTATLTVTDDATPAQTTTATVTITATAPPVITAFTASPQTGPAPLAVTFTFTAQAGETGRRLVRYTLAFGDTVSRIEEVSVVHPATLTRTIVHTYQTGSYTARLTVFDDVGATVEATRPITAGP